MKKAFEPNVAARLKTIATLMPSGVAIAERLSRHGERFGDQWHGIRQPLCDLEI